MRSQYVGIEVVLLPFFQRSCLGHSLMDRVFTHLDLVERDYFGLKYLDVNSVSQWLDPYKEIKKQSKDKGNTLTQKL